jgi:hypothetical protein
VHSPQLARISPERVADELRGMLTLPAQGGDWAWHALLQEFPGLSDVIFRFLGPAPDLKSRAGRIRVFNGFPADNPWPFGLCLAAVSLDWLLFQQPRVDVRTVLEHQSVSRVARALRQSLRISNDEAEQLTGSLEGVGILLADPTPGVAALKRFLARPTATFSRMLLDALGCHIGAERVSTMQSRLDELAQDDYAPLPLITGDDLTAAGLRPGKAFKRALDDTYDAQLEERVKSKEEALELAIRIVRKGSGGADLRSGG